MNRYNYLLVLLKQKLNMMYTQQSQQLKPKEIVTDPNLKLFAHIHNDPQLSGSPLQGIGFEKTADHLADILTKIADGEIS